MRNRLDIRNLLYSAVVYGAAISAIVFIFGVALYQCQRESKSKKLEQKLEEPREVIDNNIRELSYFSLRNN